MLTLALRREDYVGERRAPICPDQVQSLVKQGIAVAVQTCPNRIFPAADYERAGAKIVDDLAAYPVILGLKEVKRDAFEAEKVYSFFSHTIKGQPHNMGMLARLLAQGCTLIDYECIVDDFGKRLVFFGRYAGLAGMIDSLWALGKRLQHEGRKSPFARCRLAHEYPSMAVAMNELKQIADEVKRSGPAEGMDRLIIGVAGTGNAGRGVEEVLKAMNAHCVAPESLADAPRGLCYCVFETRHLVESKVGSFDVEDYYANPHTHQLVFHRYLPYLDVLMNCIYWDDRYPRLVSLETLANLYRQTRLNKPKIIGDVSCDLHGAIEATVQLTTWDNPVFVYDVDLHEPRSGIAGNGPVIMAIYNLPAQVPIESSTAFSASLAPFLKELAAIDVSKPFAESGLSAPLQRATIAYHGELTPRYRYLKQSLQQV